MIKILKVAFFILTISLSYSCNNKNREIIQLVEHWKGKTILFPDEMCFYKYGIDTINYRINPSDYKIVTYIDSTGCKSCKLQFPEWMQIINKLDSLESTSVQVLFFVTSSNREELNYIMLRDSFDYPVCIDEFDSFNKLNNLPADMRFHTFLLDKNNKVVAIGNPVHNPDIKKIYSNIILNNGTLNSINEYRTKIDINTAPINFGEFDWHLKRDTSINIKNSGHYPLVIVDIGTSCGCTTVKYSKEPVLPGKSKELKIIYKADHPEHFSKTINIHCNVEKTPIQLRITGNAK